MTGLTNPSGQRWSWSYQNNDWLSQQIANAQAPAAQQVVTVPTRNNRGFITNLNTSLNNTNQTLLTNFAIGYNSTSGNIGSLTATIPAAPGFGGTTQYSYDSGTGGLDTQITQESSTRNGGYNYTFTPDLAGNLTTYQGGTLTYNSANQVTGTGFVYDHNGNPTTYRGVNITYDIENRPVAGGTISAGYRGDGLRAWKQTSAGKTYYLYDGDTLVLEENSSGTKTAVNTFGPSGLLARSTSTRTLLYLPDPAGNVAQQVDASSGAVVASYCFTAWGSRSVSSNDSEATSEPYTGFGGIHGYFTDWETGLQLLGHRYYDPALGRFLTRDPDHYEGGINLYEYCGNNPLGGHDPLGTSSGDWLVKLTNALGDLDGAAMAIECLAEVVKFIWQASQSHFNPTASACQGVLNCLMSMLFNVVIQLAVAILEPWLAIVAGCIAGAICGWIHSEIDSWCERNAECNHPQPPAPSGPCMLANIISDALSGCFGGWLGGFGFGNEAKDVGAAIVGALLGGVLDAGGEELCKRRTH